MAVEKGDSSTTSMGLSIMGHSGPLGHEKVSSEITKFMSIHGATCAFVDYFISV